MTTTRMTRDIRIYRTLPVPTRSKVCESNMYVTTVYNVSGYLGESSDGYGCAWYDVSVWMFLEMMGLNHAGATMHPACQSSAAQRRLSRGSSVTARVRMDFRFQKAERTRLTGSSMTRYSVSEILFPCSTQSNTPNYQYLHSTLMSTLTVNPYYLDSPHTPPSGLSIYPFLRLCTGESA